MAELIFDEVTVRYGSGRKAIDAVDAVSLVIPSGAIVGLVGESGSGKSTLARAAVGLAPVTSGRILLDGTAPSRRRRRGSRPPIQMVFQDPYSSLNPRMTIGASIAEVIPREVCRSRSARRAEVSRLLELVHLDPDRMEMFPARLSGGQRQRVALARSLATRPEVIIADEITSSLDVSVQGAVLNLVREIQLKMDLSLLFISHNLAVVRYISDRIAVMYLGRIVEAGAASDVLSNPLHPYTRELLAAAPHRGSNQWIEEAAESAAESVEAEPPDPHRPPTGCRFHPRCPIGPRVVAGREICVERDPQEQAPLRLQMAACHFVPSAGSAKPDPAGGSGVDGRRASRTGG